jgi:hypothetical protein
MFISFVTVTVDLRFRILDFNTFWPDCILFLSKKPALNIEIIDNNALRRAA